MVAAANMVEIAALVGDTARATMLAALMDGQALTSRYRRLLSVDRERMNLRFGHHHHDAPMDAAWMRSHSSRTR
jgi:hypothetical protein